MSKPHRIAAIPGDGIGTEVVPEGLRVLEAAASAFDLNLKYEHFDYASADFEPVHGSAPDIAGKGIANPIGQIWYAAMMLEHLGERDAAAAITTAMESVLAHGQHALTPDMGGNATTEELGKAVASALTAP